MTALLVFNPQRDFLPLGSSPVAGSEALPELVQAALVEADFSIALVDWHPADHISFASSHLWRKPGQVLPHPAGDILLTQMHCVADSFGAQLMPGLALSDFTSVLYKGQQTDSVPTSAFQDQHGNESELAALLEKYEIDKLRLMGLPLETEIVATAEQAMDSGFRVEVIADALFPMEATFDKTAWLASLNKGKTS